MRIRRVLYDEQEFKREVVGGSSLFLKPALSFVRRWPLNYGVLGCSKDSPCHLLGLQIVSGGVVLCTSGERGVILDRPACEVTTAP